ncbi:glycosyltransferase family 2 protein [Brevibacterium yomogidense]|uniref:glycosyltransferase family 2 protein n=1 Tax=Brevibacterium yomogidense TaxID=946573 RepID=UPI0018E01D55
MPHSPRLSVIVPAKDAAPYLPTMFRSLALQFDDPADLEVVFVNDGSSDDTPAVLEEYGPRFPHFEVVTHATAQGLANGRNAGLARAQAERIVFLDGDDWLAPGHLPVIDRALSDLGVDFVRCDHTTVTGAVRSFKHAPMSVRGLALDPRAGILPDYESTMVDYPYAWAGGFHRRLLDRGLLPFPADFQTAEDRSWIWNLHLHAESFAVVDAPGIRYRRGVATSLTQIYDRRQLDFIRAFEGIFALVEADRDAELLWPKAARNWLAILHHHAGRSAAMDGDVRSDLTAGAVRASARIPEAVLSRQLREASRNRFAAVLPYMPRRFAHVTEAVQ